MNHRRSTFIIIGLSIFWLGLAAVGGVAYRQAMNFVRPTVNHALVQKIVNQFRGDHKALETLHIEPKWREFAQTELGDPTSVVPSPKRYDREILSRLLNLGKDCASMNSIKSKDANIQKLIQWFDFKCGRSAQLNPDIWRKPPFIHPLSGTWAQWLHEQGHLKDLTAEKKFLHLLELKALPSAALDPIERIASNLTPGELEVFISGTLFMLTDQYAVVAAFSSPEWERVHVFKRTDWDRFIASASVQNAPLRADTCDFKWSDLCWNVRSDLRESNHQRYLFLLMLAVLGLTATLAGTLWSRTKLQKTMEKNQQLVMQTLAHELRHPVTGLRLSAESLRNNYDALPDEVKTETLRLLSISERMGRLVNVSQQYLKILSQDHQFAFRQDQLPSVNDFLQTVLEPYEGKLAFKASAQDCSCALDGHWFSTCLTNLVTNALTHGLQPIEVSWSRQGDDLLVTVQDSGLGPSLSLEKLIEPRIKHSTGGGMGLGVSLVHRLTLLMNGNLSLEKNPTRFTITLKGACRHEAAAA